MRDPCVGDVINLKLALTFYGISAPMGEELAMRYEEYVGSPGTELEFAL